MTLQARTVSLVYEDTRWRHEPYAINVRHTATVEILRFEQQKQAIEARKSLLKEGYSSAEAPKPAKKPRKKGKGKGS